MNLVTLQTMVKQLVLKDFAINDESLAIPLLDPDKLDMFVATVVGFTKE